MGTLWHDIRYGVRMLGRSPGFAAVAVLTLALGIGGTTAIFAVLNAHVLNPVPLRNERRLVEFKELSRARQSRVWISPPLYQDLVQQRDLFEQVVSFQHDTLQIAGQEFLEYVHGSRVTHNFLDLFEVRPVLGRWLTKEEQDAAVEDVLAQVLWEGMKPTAVGILIGLIGAFVLTRLLRNQLFGIGPTDPVTFALVPLLLTAAALLSCWFPARRAARTDPMVALRYE